MAFICGIIAAELKLNVQEAKRAGLLHDIGKAVDHEIEGAHSAIGADLAKKYGEPEDIVHAILAHHEETEPANLLDIIVQAADALSGARPGARREMLESYIKRLEELERIASSFSGVEKSYAIQAGREIRIVVSSDKMNDDGIFLLSKDIAKKVEAECPIPVRSRWSSYGRQERSSMPDNVLTVLFLGDVIGKPGRLAAVQFLKDARADFKIINGENMAGGLGITPALGIEMIESGVDAITTGNHVWKKKKRSSPT